MRNGIVHLHGAVVVDNILPLRAVFSDLGILLDPDGACHLPVVCKCDSSPSLIFSGVPRKSLYDIPSAIR